MFGLFKPDSSQFVRKGELKLELDAIEDEIVQLSERIVTYNARVSAANAREARAEQNEPIPTAQIEEIVKSLPQQYQGMALAFLSTPKGQKMAFDMIKGLMR